MFKMAKRFVTTLVVAAFAIQTIAFSASATTKFGEVDNDTSNRNFSNNSNTYTHYSGVWGTYLYSGKNGDSRLRQSTTQAAYEWVWNANINTTGILDWTMGVYLANASFTDTAAYYKVFMDSNIYTPVLSFYLNQNIAPSGYSYISGTKYGPSVNGGNLHPWYGLVYNSGLSNVGTGADAFNFMFDY